MDSAKLIVRLLLRLNPHLVKTYRKALLKMIKMSLGSGTKYLSGMSSRSAILRDYMKVKGKLGAGKVDPEKFIDRVIKTLQKKKK